MTDRIAKALEKLREEQKRFACVDGVASSALAVIEAAACHGSDHTKLTQALDAWADVVLGDD